MKKLIRIFGLFIALIFCMSTIASATDASTTLKVESANQSVPFQMQPGTILVYDENLTAIIIHGGYPENINSMQRNSDNTHSLILIDVPDNASLEEVAMIEAENAMAQAAYDNYILGNYIQAPEPTIYANMKVVYDEITGELNNIYYVDENEPSGYSIHNEPILGSSMIISSTSTVTATQWSWGTAPNVLTYQPLDDSFLGTGRATYFTDTTGNRDNTLVDYDCATEKTYDYSKKGDKDVQIRNLDTDEVFTFHQADVGTLPNAIIDIWGLSNLHNLAGQTGVTSVANVRYYHKRFSDQSIPT